jgi:hypothetical protein
MPPVFQVNLGGQSDTIVTHLRNIVLPRRFTRLCMFSLTVRVVLVRLANKNVTTNFSIERFDYTGAMMRAAELTQEPSYS